jgi:hypothetical protein
MNGDHHPVGSPSAESGRAKTSTGSLRFYTTEEPPRRLNVRGRSGINPDILVADNPDGGEVLWIIDGGDPKKVDCTVCGVNYRAIRFPEGTQS